MSVEFNPTDALITLTGQGGNDLTSAALLIAQGAKPTQAARPKPVDPQQYAPNGFVKQSFGTVSNAGQKAITSIFGFDPSSSKGQPVANAFSFGNSDTGISTNASIGYSDTNSRGEAAAYVSPSRVQALNNRIGITNGLDVIAAQEVAQKLIKGHPELRGKVTTEQSELVGNAVSLRMEPRFISVNMANAIQSLRNPNYSEIADAQLTAMGRVNQQLGMGLTGAYGGGAEMMNRFMNFHRANGGSEATINDAALRAFAKSEGVDPNAFMKALTTETTSEMTTRARTIMGSAATMPDR